MKRVAILGGGPAGAFAAEKLASAGMDAVLFDEKLAWEKPCGGGLTYKAYQRYPFLLDNDRPKRLVASTTLAAERGETAELKLRHPVVVYSRVELNRMLLERAERAGAQIEQTRVLAIERNGSRWKLATARGSADADFCIVATGARNPLRQVGTEWTRANTMLAVGYYVPGEQAHIDIQFLPRFEGYIWVFPRCGHLSVGICGRGEPARSLRARLEAFMLQRGISRHGATFYSHLLPSLATPAWKSNRVAGDGWLAVGDAGGLVDPVTGEGLYYAIRSADLASQVVLSGEHSPLDKPQAYRALLHKDFAANLERGAALARRLFCGKLLWASVPHRMIQIMRRSPRIHEVMQDLFAGTQGYLDLKQRLLGNFQGTLFENAANFLLSRLVPGET